MQVSLETWRRLHAACPKCGASGTSLKIEGLASALSGEGEAPDPGKAKVTCFGVKPVEGPEMATEECDFQGTAIELVPTPEDVRLANIIGALNLADHLKASVTETQLSPGALAAIVLAQELVEVLQLLKLPPGEAKAMEMRQYLSYMGFSLPDVEPEQVSKIIQI
jgi:hypothetical protein